MADMYRLRDNPGCVQRTYTAVQNTGLRNRVQEVFPHLVVQTAYFGTLQITDDAGQTYNQRIGEWLVETDEHRLVLSHDAFMADFAQVEEVPA